MAVGKHIELLLPAGPLALLLAGERGGASAPQVPPPPFRAPEPPSRR